MMSSSSHAPNLRVTLYKSLHTKEGGEEKDGIREEEKDRTSQKEERTERRGG
jgi:hypothetical protein